MADPGQCPAGRRVTVKVRTCVRGRDGCMCRWPCSRLSSSNSVGAWKFLRMYVKKGFLSSQPWGCVYLTVAVCFQCHGDGLLHGQALEGGGQLGEPRVAEQQQPGHF